MGLVEENSEKKLLADCQHAALLRRCLERFIDGHKSDDINSVSYNPSVFKHSHENQSFQGQQKIA